MLKVEVQSAQRSTTVTISGRIDEKADLPTLAGIPAEVIVFDLRALEAMNSTGASLWLKWMAQFKGGPQLQFKTCPPFFLELANSIDGVIPTGAVIQSFIVPYHNPESGDLEFIEYSKGRHFDEREIMLPRVIRSEITDAKLELDIFPTRYLQFLKRAYPNMRIDEIKG